ncbi:serum amyloid A-5 protein [Strongylocentrotus purpuratus]|uniref:Serum amyloid A protein n=1 Tax=Strongylocentrotus purpuratus TaxID=7668 RepID=A0A7M7HPP4_STRPU|nr:serum amyloid A-5 protein [Strongylocentrotus purpuratus]|eukprot:XP_011679821.1 PREDICTED: serum amyloid A-5 protein [Strongylocentrotus purpuratus]
MRIAVSIIALLMAGVLVVPSEASWLDAVSDAFRGAGDFVSGAVRGAGDMWRSYSDMREANTIGADKYFHARGNYEASQRGSGGRFAARVISDAREGWQGGVSGRGAKDTQADQEANRWGRNGGDPNRYRPAGLPDGY